MKRTVAFLIALLVLASPTFSQIVITPTEAQICYAFSREEPTDPFVLMKCLDSSNCSPAKRFLAWLMAQYGAALSPESGDPACTVPYEMLGVCTPAQEGQIITPRPSDNEILAAELLREIIHRARQWEKSQLTTQETPEFTAPTP